MGGAEDFDALEEILQQPDAVLEPDVMETLRHYVMKGGQPPRVVEMLSNNYVGYAQMASLVCSWLKMSEEDSGEDYASTSSDQHHEFSFLQVRTPCMRTQPFRQKLNAERLRHLQKLVRDRFDLDKFAGVFSKGGSKPPKWLDGLAADPQGRQLIYELSGEHKNCLLLNFAIQKILYQGHENEVANVGSSLSGYFGVFHRLMVTRLRSIATASDVDLPAEVSSLANACCQDHHSYAHVQLVLAELGRHPDGARFRRLSQELEAIAAKHDGALVWRMQPAFMRNEVSYDHQDVAQLVGELLADGNLGTTPSSGEKSTVKRLHELYSGPSPPPVEPLRHPRLLKALTAALFTPDKHLSEDLSAIHIHLLALACAGVDGPRGLDSTDVNTCRTAIESAFIIAKDAMKGIRADNNAMATPAAAIGVLYFMEIKLEDLDFYRSTAALAAAPVFLKLLNQIATKHTSMREQVVGIIDKSLHAMGNSKPALARNFLDLAVLLLSYGEVAAVMQMADKWEKIADPSLVRHLVLQVLGVAAPPYSPQFASWLLRLIKIGSFRKMRDAPRGSPESYLLEEFASACLEVNFPRHLTAKESALIKELSA